MTQLTGFEPPPPPNEGPPLRTGLWLGLSITSTLCCCVPLGIVAIVFAAMAMGAERRGDHVEAQEKVARARAWTLWSFGMGLLVLFCAWLTDSTPSYS